MPEAVDLRVFKSSTQKALALLERLALLNRKLKLQPENDYVHIPLMRMPLANELEELRNGLPNPQISKREFREIREPQVRLADLLSEELPPHVLASLPHAVDFIGDIAIVDIPLGLEAYKSTVGAAILKAHKRVKTVLSKGSPVRGTYRLRAYEVIGGEVKTQTVHKEHGCIYHVDLAKAYFSSRLSYEHARIATLARENETIIDMFAGVGPFSILTAKKHANASVYAIDMNPEAYEFLTKNIAANRVTGKVTPILGDARRVVNEKLSGVADRVIMNLPEKAIEYVDVACRALKPQGGIMHYYQFVDTPAPVDTAKNRFAEAVKQTNRSLHRISETRIVRGIAPFKYQVVVDAEIK